METKNYYLQEYQYFDGEYDITFYILNTDFEKMLITLAVTRAGKIFRTECDLKLDKDNKFYFEFGIDFKKVKIEDFETITD